MALIPFFLTSFLDSNVLLLSPVFKMTIPALSAIQHSSSNYSTTRKIKKWRAKLRNKYSTRPLIFWIPPPLTGCLNWLQVPSITYPLGPLRWALVSIFASFLETDNSSFEVKCEETLSHILSSLPSIDFSSIKKCLLSRKPISPPSMPPVSSRLRQAVWQRS